MEAREGTDDLYRSWNRAHDRLGRQHLHFGSSGEGQARPRLPFWDLSLLAFRSAALSQAKLCATDVPLLGWMEDEGGFRAAGCMPEAVQAAASKSVDTNSQSGRVMHARSCVFPNVASSKKSKLFLAPTRVVFILHAPVQRAKTACRTLDTGVACRDCAAPISVCYSHSHSHIHSHSHKSTANSIRVDCIQVTPNMRPTMGWQR